MTLISIIQMRSPIKLEQFIFVVVFLQNSLPIFLVLAVYSLTCIFMIWESI